MSDAFHDVTSIICFVYSKPAKKPQAKAPVRKKYNKKNDKDIGRDHEINIGNSDEDISDHSKADNKDKKGKHRDKTFISAFCTLH
jgi:hypothetical protein